MTLKLKKSKSESVNDTELIAGIVLDKEKVSGEMPSVVKNAKIALVDFPLELKNPEIDTKVSISSPEQLQSFIIQEEESIKNMVWKVKNPEQMLFFVRKGLMILRSTCCRRKEFLRAEELLEATWRNWQRRLGQK